MTSPTVAKNQDRAFRKCMSIIHGITNEADKPAGHSFLRKSRIWVSDATPGTSTTTGVSTGDLCLDKTADEVYRYTSTDQWDLMTAET